MRFRKKPIVVEAWQLFDENISTIPDWINIEGLAGESLYINTLEGVMCASTGDWIIRGIKGEIYTCKPDIFEATYEEVHTDPLYEKAIHETQTEKLRRLHIAMVEFF